MALRTPLTVSPHMYIGDSTGRPLDNGMVYFGLPDQDPEHYPINIFSDDGLMIPVSQPVRTKGGYLNDNKGDMAEIHAKELIYSVKVLDQYGRKIFYKGQSMRSNWNDDVIIRINETVAASQSIATNIANAAVNKIITSAQKQVNDAINNTAIEGGVLADTFVTLTPIAVDGVARNLRDKNAERVSVKDFGAKGNDDQALIDITPYKVRTFTISKQTQDGLAFCKALNYLKSIGGGSLYVPRGTYRVYGTLPVIDFPLKVYGEGGASLIINCDTSPAQHGYGLFTVEARTPVDIYFSDLKLDGNGQNRVKPVGEFQLYNLCVYGSPRFRATNITSVNCLIDCFYVDMTTQTGYSKHDMFCHVSASVFDNSYRNTISCISGQNIMFEGCTVTRGGFLHGGTNPRYCVDIEPNTRTKAVQTRWVNCHIASARNVVLGGIWTKSQFVNCTIDTGDIYPDETRPDYPWLTSISAGQWDFENCDFQGRKDTSRGIFRQYNNYAEDFVYSNAAYLRLKGCNFSHAGLISESRTITLIDCYAQNSLIPFYFGYSNDSPREDVYIRNLHLVNIFDGYNAGAGRYSSFAINNDREGVLDINGLVVEVDTPLLKEWGISPSVFTLHSYNGVWFANQTKSRQRILVKNVHVEGYYKRLPLFLNIPPNENTHRDWNVPGLPPPDTDTIKTVISAGSTATSTIQRVPIGSLSTTDTAGAHLQLPYYKDCTMWGKYD